MRERDDLVQAGCSEKAARLIEEKGALFVKSSLTNEKEGTVISAKEVLETIGSLSFDSAVSAHSPWVLRGNVKQGFMITVIHGLDRELELGQTVNPSELTAEAVELFKSEEKERD